jgi:hypothetical protein
MQLNAAFGDMLAILCTGTNIDFQYVDYPIN